MFRTVLTLKKHSNCALIGNEMNQSIKSNQIAFIKFVEEKLKFFFFLGDYILKSN